jgi:hypothetical protein
MQLPYYSVFDFTEGQLAVVRDFDVAYDVATSKSEGRKIIKHVVKNAIGVSVWGSTTGFKGTADVDVTDPNKLLHKASVCGDAKFVEYLLDKKGADVHYRADLPLISASKNGHCDVAKVLIDKGAWIDGQEPIRQAIKGGHKEVVKLLIEKGVIHYIQLAVEHMGPEIELVASRPSVVRLRNKHAKKYFAWVGRYGHFEKPLVYPY